MNKPLKRYDAQFKRDAVDLLISSGKPLKVLAVELGVSDVTLRSWRDRHLAKAEPIEKDGKKVSAHQLAHELRQAAKILNTGEVVPDHVIPPSVSWSKQGNNLMLTWPPGWFLQTATNVIGPYIDVPSATSPYPDDLTLEPQRFFRLRQ